MVNVTHVTPKIIHEKIPLQEAISAGQIAYQYFYSNKQPELSPLTLLSFSIRRYDDNKTLPAEIRKKLTDDGFLLHGERTPLKRRLRLPGIVAVSLVVPEIEHGQLAGEYLEEPFREIDCLEYWYGNVARSALKTQTRLSWLRE